MENGATIQIHRSGARRLAAVESVGIGLGAGLIGGVALAAPIVIYDWASSAHKAFELLTAPTAWLFGLEHFSNTGYNAWPLVIGLALLAGYSALSGLVFTGLADRVFGVARPLQSIGAGLAWSFVSFVFFWDMLLPIARDGAPFRAVAGTAQPFVAPNWVWILGFTLLGLATGVCYAALRTSPAREEVRQGLRTTRSSLHRAA
jgi:hypothetical protein